MRIGILLAFTASLLAQPHSFATQAETPQLSTQTGTQTSAQSAPQTRPERSIPAAPLHQLIPLPPHAPVTPGQVKLIELESRFAQDVAELGGKGFSSWFADDAVTLSNGQPPVRGRAAIAAAASWDPRHYTLTWVAEGADMAPASDMGYTWGHYQGLTTDSSGHQTRQTGRYVTIWKKQANGSWKVSLEASAEDAPGSGTFSLP